MIKAQMFSTDASLAFIFFMGIITTFMLLWDNEIMFASETFENNIVEFKSLNLLDFLLTNEELGIVNDYYEVSDYKLNSLIFELNNYNYNKSEEFGLNGYDIVVLLQYLNNTIILSSFDTITSYQYRFIASKNCFYEGEAAKVTLMVSKV